MMIKDIIFFDKDCAFCLWCVCKIIRWDKNKRFVFAPLHGQTAKNHFAKDLDWLRNIHALILLEADQKAWIKMKALLRVFYLLGKGWKFFGIFHILPGFIVNPFYTMIAKNRRLFRFLRPDRALIEKNQERFLP